MSIRVKIRIKKLLTEEQQKKLKEFFLEGAKKFDPAPEYWIHEWDESVSFCYDCAEKKVEELLAKKPDKEYCVDGGYGGESDGTPFCETCRRLLAATLTDYGAESEIEHFLTNGFDVESDEDRRAMHEVLQSMGWETSWDYWESVYRLRSAGRRYKELHHLGRVILNALNARG